MLAVYSHVGGIQMTSVCFQFASILFWFIEQFQTHSDCFTWHQTNIKCKRALIDENMQSRQFKGNKTTHYT